MAMTLAVGLPVAFFLKRNEPWNDLDFDVETEIRESPHRLTEKTLQVATAVRNERSYVFHTWSAQLPPRFSNLYLADAKGLRNWKRTSIGRSIEVLCNPATGDSTFDGEFCFTGLPTESIRQSLLEVDVRRALLALGRAFDGLWINNGTLNIINTSGKSDAERSGAVSILNSLLDQLQS